MKKYLISFFLLISTVIYSWETGQFDHTYTWKGRVIMGAGPIGRPVEWTFAPTLPTHFATSHEGAIYTLTIPFKQIYAPITQNEKRLAFFEAISAKTNIQFTTLPEESGNYPYVKQGFFHHPILGPGIWRLKEIRTPVPPTAFSQFTLQLSLYYGTENAELFFLQAEELPFFP